MLKDGLWVTECRLWLVEGTLHRGLKGLVGVSSGRGSITGCKLRVRWCKEGLVSNYKFLKQSNVDFSGSALIYPARSNEHPGQDGEGLQVLSRLQPRDGGVDWNSEGRRACWE